MAKAHALVIGVSRYDHLDGVPEWGLDSIDSAALGAAVFARWLRDEYVPPVAGGKHVEVLLSPSPADAALLSADERALAPATGDNVSGALDRWKQACSSDPENIAVLYLAGHGAWYSLAPEGAVLLQDFAVDPEKRMVNAVGIAQALRGMWTGTARRQFWFVDACRFQPADGQNLLAPGLPQWNPKGRKDVRVQPLYSSSTFGGHAFGRAGEPSVFAQGLLRSLERDAIERRGTHWHVSDTSLAGALSDNVDRIAREEGLPQAVDATGSFRSAPFHVLTEPPPVDFTVGVTPEAAGPCARGTLTPNGGLPVYEDRPLEVPVRETVAGGDYVIDVALDPAHPHHHPQYEDTTWACIVEPAEPDHVWVRVIR